MDLMASAVLMRRNTSAAGSENQQRRYLTPALAPRIVRLMSDKSKKRGEITAVHIAEAEALRAIWNSKEGRAARAAKGFPTQDTFGPGMGIGTQGAVWQFMNARVPISIKAAVGFARGLNCEVRDFSPRLAGILERGEGESEGEQASQAGPRALSAEAQKIADLVDSYDSDGRSWILNSILAMTQAGARRPPKPPGEAENAEPAPAPAHSSAPQPEAGHAQSRT